MTTTIIARPGNDQQAKALKAVMKALKIAFEEKAEESISSEKALLMEEIKEAVENLKLVRQGKLKARPAKDLLHEL